MAAPIGISGTSNYKSSRIDQGVDATCNLNSLPDKLLKAIFSYNETFENYKNVSLVNRRFYRILTSEEDLVFKGEPSEEQLEVIYFYKTLKRLVLNTLEPVEDICKLLRVDSLENGLSEILQRVESLNLSKLIATPFVEATDIEEEEFEEEVIEDDEMLEWDLEQDKFTETLKHFEGLKELDVSGNWDCMSSPAELIVADPGLQKLFGGLERLNMAEIGVDRKVLGLLKYCKNLQELNLSGNSKLVEAFEELSEEEGKLFFESIKVLDISKIKMTDKALFNVSKFCNPEADIKFDEGY